MAEKHPFTDEVFPIPWAELTPEAARIDIYRAIKLAEENIEKIGNLTENEINYDSVFKALDSVDKEVSVGTSYLGHLTSVCDSEPIREVHKEIMPKVTEFYTQMILNPRLWSVIKKCAQKLEGVDLPQAQRRFIEQTLLDFRLSGADLEEDKKIEFAQINVDLEKLSTEYKQNVLDSTNAFELYIDAEDKTELEGLPESSLSMAKDEAEKKGQPGKYLFTLHFPSCYPVMKYAKSENLRKKIWEGTKTIGKGGKYDNTELIFKLALLRSRKAELLGFKSHADLTTKNRMALTGDNALNFVEDLHNKIFRQFKEDCETVLQYKKKVTGDNSDNCEVYPWETHYYAELLRKEKYDFDDESLRPYFPVDDVMKGVFTITSTLYNIDVREKPTFCRSSSSDPVQNDKIEVWQEDVKYFEVFDKETGEQLGGFYADWHPRSNKKSGAWHRGFYNLGSKDPKTLDTICGNVQKAAGGKPALLDHYEVETIFHEFGHLCHNILSKTDILSFAGTSVARDFVEVPSQFLENWTWEKDALNLFAHHYETKEPIPNEVYNKMMAAKNFMSASFMMRQLSFGRIDLEFHHRFKENCAGKTIEEIQDNVLADYIPKCSVKQVSILYQFLHLFGSSVGYSAGYYSYLWAEVLEADAFTRFQKEGILNEKVGKEFRDKILIWGNSKPAGDMFKDFMKRDPDPEALLKRANIKI